MTIDWKIELENLVNEIRVWETDLPEEVLKAADRAEEVLRNSEVEELKDRVRKLEMENSALQMNLSSSRGHAKEVVAHIQDALRKGMTPSAMQAAEKFLYGDKIK